MLNKIWVQRANFAPGFFATDTGVVPPTTAISIRHALSGAVYHASKGETFGSWSGVVSGVATFYLGLLRVNNDCTHATADNGNIIVSTQLTLTNHDHGVCFNLTPSSTFTFQESDLIVPIAYSTTTAGPFQGTTRIKINRE